MKAAPTASSPPRAGNHAQALAAAAAARGVPCEVFVPADAPMAKVEAARSSGATVHVGGKSVDECLVAAHERAETGGLAFVHPFDDPAIVAGQGSLGLELLEEVPDLAKVVIPVGGGGLCAGVALAIKDAKPRRADRRRPGRRVRAVPGVDAQAGEPIEAKSAITIADGIAIKRPGGITLAAPHATLIDDMVVVGEDATAEAMALLLERCKLVVEGAGAVGVAALLGGQVKPAETASRSPSCPAATSTPACWRRSRAATRPSPAAGSSLLTRIPDRPGGLATLLAAVAATGANIVDVSHVREGPRPARARDRRRAGAGDARPRARAARARHAQAGGLRGAGSALGQSPGKPRATARQRDCRGMKLPRMLLVAGLVALLAPAAANADSIVYIDQGNVWSADAGRRPQGPADHRRSAGTRRPRPTTARSPPSRAPVRSR